MSIRVGPHEFLVRLSAGRNRHAYLARTERAGRPRLLTIKVLRPEAAADRDASRRFLSEAKTLARIRHPAIIETAGYGVIRNLHCIGTEFVFGVTMQEALQEGIRRGRGLSAQAVLRIIATVLEGLDAAHHEKDKAGRPLGLVHRAVTPANILLGFNGQPKLSDFGLAKVADRGWETMPGRVTGKTSYISPEQILAREVDARSDIFCTGVVLWELLAGRPLFRGAQIMEVARAITQGRVPPPSRYAPDLPAGTDEVVLRALDKAPERRFQTAGAMAGAIDQIFLQAGLAVEPSAVAMELASLFGQRIALKARALRDALAGRPDEAALCEILGATPLDEDDLIGDLDEPEAPTGAQIPDAATEMAPSMASEQATVVSERPPELEALLAQRAGLRAASEVTSEQQGWNDTMSVELGHDLRAMLDAPTANGAEPGDELLEETEQG